MCLATNYTELLDAGPGTYGTPNVGWFDTEGEPYVNSICAMVGGPGGGGDGAMARRRVQLGLTPGASLKDVLPS